MTIIPKPCHGFSLTENIVSTFAAINPSPFLYLFSFSSYACNRMQKGLPLRKSLLYPYYNIFPLISIISSGSYTDDTLTYTFHTKYTQPLLCLFCFRIVNNFDNRYNCSNSCIQYILFLNNSIFYNIRSHATIIQIF